MKILYSDSFKFFCLAAIIMLPRVTLAAQPAASPLVDPLVFGVLNQQSPIQTAERWNPILRYLGKKTGAHFQLKMGATVEQTDAMMGREEFDLIFTNHNFQTEYDGKYRVLAHRVGKPIQGVIVVNKDSPIRSLKDLQGRTVAFPSADAVVGYAVPSVALKEIGVSVTAKFAGNQEGALAQLKARRVDAAAVNLRFVEPYSQREGLHTRTIYISESFHEIPVVIHPRVPPRLADEIRTALIGMATDPAAAAMLNEAKCPGFEAADESDYENVRRVYRLIGQ